MIIATAGHVDHGKTSLVNALTGVNTDRLEEEKARGLTIDLGFAYSNAETGNRLGFVDVPGHIKFINNMLAGVSAIDYALLVVAADDGVMPQTVEHLEILNLLGVNEGCIAVTKIDRCDDTQIETTREQIETLVAGSFLENADIYPVSAITQDGIETLALALAIAAEDCATRDTNGRFRLAIDRSFSVKGAGIVVTGSVFDGSIHTGDEVLLMPQKIACRVRGLHTQNEEAQSASAGDRCAVNITAPQLELDGIHRGNWLTTNPQTASTRVDINLRLLDNESKPLRHWTPVHIHSAANHMIGRIALLSPTKLEPGGEGLAQIVFEPAVNLCVGDRVVIRDQAALRTLGGGQVIDTDPPKRGRAKPERIEALTLIDPNDPMGTFENMALSEPLGISLTRFSEQFNLSEDDTEMLVAVDGYLKLGDDLMITAEHLADRKIELDSAVEAWHEAHPDKAGLPANQIKQLVRRWSATLVDTVLKALIEAGKLEQQGNQYNKPGSGVQLSHQEQKIWATVQPLLAADLTRPPVLHDLAAAADIPPKQMEKLLNQVLKTGLVIRPVKNRYFLKDALPELIHAMQTCADEQGQFTVQAYRDQTGIGRNLCIELLEYFDRKGQTRRVGDVRQIMEVK